MPPEMNDLISAVKTMRHPCTMDQLFQHPYMWRHTEALKRATLAKAINLGHVSFLPTRDGWLWSAGKLRTVSLVKLKDNQ